MPRNKSDLTESGVLFTRRGDNVEKPREVIARNVGGLKAVTLLVLPIVLSRNDVIKFREYHSRACRFSSFTADPSNDPIDFAWRRKTHVRISKNRSIEEYSRVSAKR